MNELLSIDSINNVVEVYGQEYLDNVLLDKELLINNINIFMKYELDYDEVFARYPNLFLEDETVLDKKLYHLILSLGYEYKELLDLDLSLYENIID